MIGSAAQMISKLDADILLAHLLGISRPELYIYDGGISTQILERFSDLAEERASGKPLQYIIGKTEFMGLEFIVTPDVFIPRPETELLVEKTIGLVRGVKRPLILDLGTGSGIIAIALTKFITDCKIMSSDISQQALFIARKNARLNLVDEKIEFIASDLFENLPKTKFDIIVSNPPYVASSDINGLQKEISFEPRIALDGGGDGLAIYRRLLKKAGQFLINGGLLILEVGFGQADEVEKLFRENAFKNIQFYLDYDSIKRIAVAQWID